MQTTSASYKTAIAATDREIRGYIKFNNTFTLDGAGGLISFKTTQNAMDAERFCVGSVCSAMCEATFYNSGLEGSGVSLANSYFDAYIGVVTDATNNTVEYVCCGRYYISEISRGADTTKIVGYDIAGRLSMDYVPTVTADPTNGYLVMDILNDIISQTGVNGGDPFTTFGDDVYVPEIYSGNCRAQWGWLCSLVSAKAASYSGTREPSDLGYIKEYYAGNGVATPYAVDESTTYMDGLSLGDAFTVTSFTTGTTENPIVIGTGTGLYGLNPYMDNTTATTIENGMHNYAYYPTTLRWRGDPAIDILDEVNVTQGTNTYKVVVMKMETTFNGGLEQTITCWGDSESYYAMSTSPTQGQINRVSSLVQEIQQAIETADGGVITKILDTDGTWKELVIANSQDLSQATSVWRFNINGLAHSNSYQGGTYTLAMDTQGRIVANVIQTGTLQDSAGKNSWNLDTGALTITEGSLNITTSSETYDVIGLNSGGWHNELSPLQVFLRNDGIDAAMLVQAGGIFGYAPYSDESTRTRKFSLSAATGNLLQFDDNDIRRQALGNTGTLRQYDGNDKLRTYLEFGDIMLYTAAEKQTAKLSGAAFASGGSLQLSDTSAVERARLTIGDLVFYDSSGAQKTVHLKADGTYGGQLQLFDPSGAQELASLGEQVGGGGVWLSNTSGNPVAQLRAYYAANGYGLLNLYDGSSTNVRTGLNPNGLHFYDANGNAILTYPAAPSYASVSSPYVTTLRFTRVGNIVTMVLLDPTSLVANGLRNLGVVIPDGFRPYAVSGTNLPYDMPGQIRVFVYPSGQIQIYNFTTNTGTMNVSMTVTWSAI